MIDKEKTLNAEASYPTLKEIFMNIYNQNAEAQKSPYRFTSIDAIYAYGEDSTSWIGEDCDLKAFAKKEHIETSALEQINKSAKSPAFEEAKIRIMPDVHTGKGSVIGFTAEVSNGRVIPNVVGVDIGCGMLTVPLQETDVDLVQLVRFIRHKIPSGFKVHSEVPSWFELNEDHMRIYHYEQESFRCFDGLKNLDHLQRSCGTLGGGNHFIEIDKDDDGRLYLIVHSGSRNLGLQVAEYYQRLAIERNNPGVESDDLAYLEGQDTEDYLHDMELCVGFAKKNREQIAADIMCEMGLTYPIESYWHTIHNYIEVFADGSYIIRKGAIRANRDERVLIPLNMATGSVIGTGKGNSDWNYSAPHGAGRNFSRNHAYKTLSMDEFKERMEGIYSTSICKDTLDESPMAYKDPDYIMSYLDQTIENPVLIKPIWNFKAHEKRRR